MCTNFRRDSFVCVPVRWPPLHRHLYQSNAKARRGGMWQEGCLGWVLFIHLVKKFHDLTQVDLSETFQDHFFRGIRNTNQEAELQKNLANNSCPRRDLPKFFSGDRIFLALQEPHQSMAWVWGLHVPGAGDSNSKRD